MRASARTPIRARRPCLSWSREGRGRTVMSAQPIHELRFGFVRASIWANGPNHELKHHVTFQRLYKDGDVEKVATGFRTIDLPVLAFTTDEAYWWLKAREESEQNGDDPSQATVVRPDPEFVALFRKSASLVENAHGRPV